MDRGRRRLFRVTSHHDPRWNPPGDHRLFLLNDDAELIVARGSRTGFEPLKRYIVADSATWAQPTISGNRVFVKDVTSLALWTLP